MDQSPFDLYTVKHFFDAPTCRELIAEMRSSRASAAVTYGKGDAAVDENVRRVSRITLSEATVQNVSCRLERERAAIARHFCTELSGFEEPQFLQYRVGDFFVAHQDGNTGMLRLETDRTRRISVSIFLNTHSEVPTRNTFAGGALVFHDWGNHRRTEIAGEAGLLIAFRSETTHEVELVTAGERYSIVSWYLQG